MLCFLHKLYDLLKKGEELGLDDIVSWCGNGKSFKIHSRMEFEECIMPFYFSGTSFYKSFLRRLNMYEIYQHKYRNQNVNCTHDANGTYLIHRNIYKTWFDVFVVSYQSFLFLIFKQFILMDTL